MTKDDLIKLMKEGYVNDATILSLDETKLNEYLTSITKDNFNKYFTQTGKETSAYYNSLFEGVTESETTSEDEPSNGPQKPTMILQQNLLGLKPEDEDIPVVDPVEEPAEE